MYLYNVYIILDSTNNGDNKPATRKGSLFYKLGYTHKITIYTDIYILCIHIHL